MDHPTDPAADRGVPAFPPQITSTAARVYAAELVDRYAGLGDVPALTAVDVLDGAAAGACRAVGLSDEQARRALSALFADRGESTGSDR